MRALRRRPCGRRRSVYLQLRVHVLRGLLGRYGPRLPQLRWGVGAPSQEGDGVILHDNLSSGNGYKVRLLLAQLGLPFERIEYEIDLTEEGTEQFELAST